MEFKDIMNSYINAKFTGTVLQLWNSNTKKAAQFYFKPVTLNADWVYLCEPWELASLLFLSTILLRLQLISAGPCKQRTELNQAHPLYK